MSTYIIIKNIDGSELREENLLSFSFKKDVYLPYTTLNATICIDTDNIDNGAEIFFYASDKLVHHGLIDTMTVTFSGGSNIFTVASRGFTSLLCQNQIEPGLKFNVSINNLMDSYAMPYVTHEDNSDTGSYIYVKNNSSIWEGVVNLSYKHYGMYPYIRGTNCVRMSAEANPNTFSYDNSQLLSIGSSVTCRRFISHFHMADINKVYGNYEFEDTDVSQHKIVRHKYFELDMQFLQDPPDALQYHDKYSSRGWKQKFCTYSGYNGEDLSDIISFGNIVSERISEVEIKGNSNGIITKISVYHDKFSHGD